MHDRATPVRHRQGSWQPGVDRTAWADINGGTFTLHDMRNCDHRTEADYTPRRDARAVRFSQLTGVDRATYHARQKKNTVS